MDELKHFDRRVLVADDAEFYQTLLEGLLTQWKLTVQCVGSGKEALDILSQPDGPRLAILDWLMPEMSGIEACKRIKSAADERYVYVIIVTGSDESAAAQAAFEADADDFMTKPIQSSILRTRLRSAAHMLEHELRLESERRTLQEHATRLEALASERAAELAKAQHMATLGTMSAGIAHEINNPTSFISANTQTLSKVWSTIEPLLREPRSADTLDPMCEFALTEVPKMIAGIQNGVKRVTRIIDSLRFYARPEVGRRTPCEIPVIVNRAIQEVQSLLHGVDVRCSAEAGLPQVELNEDTICQVFVNLLTNAAHSIRQSERKKIEISVRRSGEGIEVAIRDTGAGIPELILENYGKPFFTTKTAGHGTGLGLYICKAVLKQHGAELTMRNGETGGAEVSFTLPLMAETSVADDAGRSIACP